MGKYTKALGKRICELIADGSTITDIGKDETNGLPKRRKLYKWRERHPAFEQAYQVALHARAEMAMDEVRNNLRLVKEGKLEYSVCRMLNDSLFKLAAIEDPKRFSEKQRVVHSGDKDGPAIKVESTNVVDLIAKIDGLIERQAIPKPQADKPPTTTTITWHGDGTSETTTDKTGKS